MEHSILAIGAHIGDMELTAGGLLATCALQGGSITTLALTAGEKGAPKGADIAEYRKQKVQEAENFAAKLGGKAKVLDYPDGLLADDDAVRMQVAAVIREVQPELIITHHSQSMHKDHAACHRIVKDAWFYAATAGFDLPGAPHFGKLIFAENWEDAPGYHPYLYKEISPEGFALWQEAIRCHWFVTGSKSFPYMEYYSHLKRLRGIEARRQYAETFMVSPEEQRVIVPL